MLCCDPDEESFWTADACNTHNAGGREEYQTTAPLYIRYRGYPSHWLTSSHAPFPVHLESRNNHGPR